MEWSPPRITRWGNSELFCETKSSIRCTGSEYEGHSLAMLNRIAAALNRRVVIQFVPVEAEPTA